jgi:hypothetical protein
LQVEYGLPKSLVLGQDDLLGSVTVLCFKTEALARIRVDTIESASAFAAGIKRNRIFIRMFGSVEEKFSEVLRCSRHVRVCWCDYAPVNNLVPVLVPVAAPCRGKTLAQKRLRLEARVGIGPIFALVRVTDTR